jgi:energy-coupling factor transporter ATP-binding protein EcfA2
MDAIAVEGLEKRYKQVRALDGVSFAVREGEVFGLLGPNGAGKSTTVRILATLTKPDAGRAEVGGHDVRREAGAVRRTISQGIALLTRREATMIGLANFIGLPLLFISTTLIARAQMPAWMRAATHANPMDWGVRAAREVVLPGTAWSTVGLYLLFLLVLSAITAGFATWCLRAYERTL